MHDDSALPVPLDQALERLRDLHERIRRAVTGEHAPSYSTTPVHGDSAADVSFAPDVDAEAIIDSFCREWADAAGPFRLVTEESVRIYPDGADEDAAQFRLIMDPIDGTRVFLRDIRSAWTMSAIATEPSGAKAPRLMDAVVALQSEIPVAKQDRIDHLSVCAGSSPRIERVCLRSGESLSSNELRATEADEIEHAFLVFNKFFPEGKGAIATLEEAVCARLGETVSQRGAGRSYFFEDQYMSTGGQFYCLATGAYAVVADIRPRLDALLARRGEPAGLTAHPYDLATLRVVADAGVRFTDLEGAPLDLEMNNHQAVGFIGYANDSLRRRIEPAILAELDRLEHHAGFIP